MVNRIAAKLSPSVRAAAAHCSAAYAGNPKKHIDRLRTRYRVLGRRGALPREEPAPSRRQSYKNAVRAMYGYVDAKKDAAVRDLGPLEAKAGALGIVIGDNLEAVLRAFERTKEDLESLLSSPDYGFAHFREKGLTADEAMAATDQADSDLQSVTEKVDLLRKIRSLRSIAMVTY